MRALCEVLALVCQAFTTFIYPIIGGGRGGGESGGLGGSGGCGGRLGVGGRLGDDGDATGGERGGGEGIKLYGFEVSENCEKYTGIRLCPPTLTTI